MIPFRLALAQINPTVGALRKNRELIASRIGEARELGADCVLFPELSLTGYPPEDLLLESDFLDRVRDELESLIPVTRGILAVVGAPIRGEHGTVNAAVLLLDGKWIDSYAKGTLPNYGVFDEKRYFRPGLRCPLYRFRGVDVGINICEDVWTPGGVPAVQAAGGASMLWNISSSPYHADKGRQREALIRRRAMRHGTAVAYANLVGGQDELVFDGESLLVDAAGNVRARAPQFREAMLVADIDETWLAAPAAEAGLDSSGPVAESAGTAAEPRDVNNGNTDDRPGLVPSTGDILPDTGPEPGSEPIDEIEPLFRLERVELPDVRCLCDEPEVHIAPRAESPTDPAAGARPPAQPERIGSRPPLPADMAGLSPRVEGEAEVYAALRLGLHDYVLKNGFERAVIGLSGGIDSALTAVLAADALGPDRVLGVSMPSRFNSPGTRRDAGDLARNLGITFREIPIEAPLTSFIETLHPVFEDRPHDVTEENIQARVRGTILMAISNKFGHLVLTTGNKSELAVGYCTLYGDMAGGFAVLKDVPKTFVYRLAQYRNSMSPVIPADTIERPPSAELRDDQLDSDTLPPYDLLDRILQGRLEENRTPDELIAEGLDPKWVRKVYRWIDTAEYKRRQAPPGVKITPRAFGRDRRFPIVNHYGWGE